MLLIKSVAACVLFIVIWEICAQIDDKVRFDAHFGGDYAYSNLFKNTPYGPFGLPGARFEKWQMNNLGFRGTDSITKEKPEGVIRILCLGASETFGLYEEAGGEWPNRLARTLNEKEPGRYEVINGALPGLSLPYFISTFEAKYEPLEPDIVLLYQSNRHYLYKAKDEVLKLDRNTRPTPPPADFAPPTAKPASAYRPRIIRKAKLIAKQLAPQHITLAYRKWKGDQAFRGVQRSFGLKSPLESVPEGNLESLKKDLETLAKMCNDRDISIIFSTHAYDLKPENLIAFRRFVPSIKAEAIPAFCVAYNLATLDVANRLNIPVADLSATIPSDSEHFADHCHFLDPGAEAAAQTFAEAVLHHGQ